MAFAEVFINNSGTTASDLYNSGCPRTAIINSATNPTDYLKASIAGTNVVTITCKDNTAAVAMKALLDAAVATTPRMLLFVNDATAATRNFAWFASGDYAVVASTVVFTLTGGQTFATTASGLDWGIGGERATIGSASSSRLLYNAGKGNLCKPTQVNGESVRVVVCGTGTEVIPELRINLPGPFTSGAGGTQFQIVSEKYAATPVLTSRPTLAFTGAITTAILYEGADLEFDNGLIAGLDICRLTGTTGGSGNYAIRFYSHVRIDDCRFYCASGASTINWIAINLGTGTRGSAVVGCTVVGHTTTGINNASGGTANRFIDNTVVGGTFGINIPSASTWEALITGNRIANCTTRGISWATSNNTAGRGSAPPVEVSHNTVYNCGVGIYIDAGNVTGCEGQFTFAQVRNNNVETCTTGITTNATTNPSAATLEGLGLLCIGNNTGSGSSACGTRYGGNLSVIAQGEVSTNTSITVSVSGPDVTFRQTTPLSTSGMGSSPMGASSSSSGTISARPLPGPARR